MVDLGGYVIILTQSKTGKIKLYGSPADRSDCDEVLEINGRSLDDVNHQDIIQYIHQCIQTKTICLRVKRRTSGKLAPDCTLIDAFVIGSRAREHLAKIAKDTHIIPRDIAQLSRILGDSTDGSPSGDHVNAGCSRVTSASAAVTSVLSSSITSASSAPNVHHSSNNNTSLLPGVTSLHEDSLSPSSSQFHPHSHHSRVHPPFRTGHQQQPQYHLPQLHQQPRQESGELPLPLVPSSSLQQASGGPLQILPSGVHHHHPHLHQATAHHHQILRHQYSGDSAVAPSAALSSSIRKVRLTATSSSPAAVVPVTSSPPPSLADSSIVESSNITSTSIGTTTSTATAGSTRYHPQIEHKIFRRTGSRPDSTDGAEIEYYELKTTTSIPISNAPANRMDLNEMPTLYQQGQQQFVTTTAPSSCTSNMRQQNVTKIPIGGPPHYVPSSSSGSSVPTSSSPASSSSQPSSSSGPAVSSSVIVIGATPHPHAPLHHYNFQTGQQLPGTSSSSSRTILPGMEEASSDSIGPATSHREMPIDVPDSFVGVVKTAPRYPPPASMRTSSLNQSGQSQSIHSSNVSQGMSAPAGSAGSSSTGAVVDMDRIRKYSEDVRTKRSEDEFLRSSLRGSKKLLQLEQKSSQQQQSSSSSSSQKQTSAGGNIAARINAAYEPDEDEVQNTPLDTTTTATGIPFVSPSALADLESLVSRVSSQITNGDLKNALEKCRISKLLAVYSAVMSQKSQSRQPSTLPPAAALPSTELVQEIIAMLQEDSSLNADVAELLEILTRFELEGVCFAFDQILLSKKATLQQQQRLASPSTPPNAMSAGNNVTSNITPCGTIEESIIPTAVTVASTTTTGSGSGASSAHLASVADANVTNVLHPPPPPPQPLVPAVRSPASYDPLTEAQMKESQVLADMSFDPYVKVVRIEKSTSDPLGATVRNEPDGSVIIGRIVKGGAAEKCGLLREGDEILEVNGIEMKGRNVNQVCEILQEMTGMLTFVIAQRSTSGLGMDDAMITADATNVANPLISGSKMAGIISSPHPGAHTLQTLTQTQVIHVKAQFDYDPAIDLYIPCRELGICFLKGEILHVIDQTDCNWWQAYREGETAGLAGLIPSMSFQLQREAMKQSILTDSSNKSNNNNNNNLTTGLHHNNNNNVINSTRALNYKNSSSIASDRNGCKKKSSSSSLMLLNCGKRSHEKRKKRRSLVPIGSQEILTYEEVALYYPRANIKRPIVLIGPTSIGRQYLRTRLMKDRERFEAAVPHTSRPIKPDGSEVDGIDYHFITRAQFEQGIREGRFVEHGEFEKNYYGTSLEAIEAVVQSGKICVLNLHVHSINILRSGSTGAKLKPYFVFVSPPSQIEKLNRLINAVALAIEKESASDHRHHSSSSHHASSHTSSHHSSSHHSHAHRQLSPGELQAIIDEGREIDARYGHYFDMVLNVTDIEKAYNDLLEEINALERDPQWIPVHWLKQ